MTASEAFEDSILTSVKKQLNIAEDYEAFDQDIILLINSSFATLHQLGVGPENGFYIVDSTTTWSEYLTDQPLQLMNVKKFVYLETRLTFDPPQASVLTAFEKQLDELKWRIAVAVDELERG